ncbi:MAG: GspH/FimT family pseudopilin [Chlamydiae bacterium]|nr:GspH/FimT family pseudopilin [Chlamydiota bacterium]MBI3276878.1 GspH/FimT family pseudopilin [Chlamydiota bacterium]
MTLPIGEYNKKGFTLIELLIVILIIGLIVLLGLPTFTKFGSNIRLKSAAQQVASLLRMARGIATTQNISTTVTIYTSNTNITQAANKIYITTASGSQLEKVWVASPLVQIPDVSGNSQNSGSTQASSQTITFSPYGTTSNSSIHIIQKGTLIEGNPYNPGSTSYSSTTNPIARSERVKCYSVTILNTTGRAAIYYYGRGQPWSNTNL